MAVELRNRLQRGFGQPLPSTLTFEYPTIEALSGYLAAEILGVERPSRPEAAEVEPSADPSNVLDRIERLADEEVDRLLAERATAGGEA